MKNIYIVIVNSNRSLELPLNYVTSAKKRLTQTLDNMTCQPSVSFDWILK